MGEPSPTLEDEFLGQKRVNFDATDDTQIWTLSESGWVFPMFCTPSGTIFALSVPIARSARASNEGDCAGVSASHSVAG